MVRARAGAAQTATWIRPGSRTPGPRTSGHSPSADTRQLVSDPIGISMHHFDQKLPIDHEAGIPDRFTRLRHGRSDS